MKYLRRSPIHLQLVCSLFIYACAVRKSSDDDLKSGPGGKPSQWTCDQLKSEYTRLRPDLVSALKAFEESKSKLKDPPAEAPKTPPKEDKESANTRDELQLTNQIAQGEDAIPEMPEPIKSFKSVFENGAGMPGKNPVGCDDAYEKYALDSSNRILEQCRYVVKLNNLLINIAAEYNQSRDGECRAGKAQFQTGQVTTIFPYCINPCRFGLTACTKCEFMVGRLTSSYICGDEQDALQAVKTHCKAEKCADAKPHCTSGVFNDIAIGTTANKDSNTRTNFKANVGAKLNIELVGGAVAKATGTTRVDANIEARILLKNSRGAPLLSVNGGETATVYSCVASVGAMNVTEVGAEVGVGYDLVIAKGGATFVSGSTLEIATSFNSQSRDIPAAGVTMVNMLDGCKNFASDWAKNDLPALLTENVVLKSVAARYMGKTKDFFSQDIRKSDTHCATDRRQPFLSSGPVQYAITQVWWDLREDSVGFKYRYEGTWNSYNSAVFTFKEADIGAERYASLRKQIFDGEVSDEDIRNLIQSAFSKGGWVKSCKVGAF